MTPLQAAREHCDNFQPDGTCLGIIYTDMLSPVRFLKEGTKCLLACPVKRCRHFEQASLPMESRSEWAKDSRKSDAMASDFKQACKQYRMESGFLSKADRVCPHCKSRELQPRQRFCYVCSEEVRLEKDRARKRRV